ncbi:unnamed protein product [Darwinula stevensoni]|uniref:Proteasomal ubiquitin receptor ADRM1 homolog n=1 Tax=Darwinula stevensoni TaxID=69355 RepID=A0A7R9A9L2_9CRUS|nr:unnamed protein product [Darwinula stevensoni]CAG0897404.1 unnamed protein product [Darwinula stevensoni]
MAGLSPLFGGVGRSQSKNLVEFRAGKMFMKGNTVHPDKRKGTVYVYQSDDTLMHFCWKDRSSGSVEDDLIIFPDDVEFKKIPECTTGRVFLLKFKSSSRKLFFWMQEPKVDKDEEFCNKVNEYLNHPPSQRRRHDTDGGSLPIGSLPPELAQLAGSGNSDVQNLLSGMSQQQLLQLFGMGGLGSLLGGVQGGSRGSSRESSRPTSSTTSLASGVQPQASSSGPASSEPAAAQGAKESESASRVPASSVGSSGKPPTPVSSQGPIQLSDLQNILQCITVPPDAAAGGSDAHPTSHTQGEALQPILSNKQFVERLKQYLPPTEDQSALPASDHLKDTIHSPQFQQAVAVFSAALQSGQLGPLIKEFGLGEDAVKAADAGDMGAFVKALSKKKKGDRGNEKKEIDDEHMACD